MTILTQSLAVAAGVLVLLRLTREARWSRAKEIRSNLLPDLKVLQLRAPTPSYDSSVVLSFWKVSLAVTSIVAIVLVIASLFLLEATLLTLVLLIECAIASATTGYMLAHLWGKRSGQAVDASTIELDLRGTISTVLQRAQRAMVARGALGPTGASVHRSADTITLQGGTGAWPKRTRGERLTISVTPGRQSTHHVTVKSESFWPTFFMKHRNSANVRFVMDELLV